MMRQAGGNPLWGPPNDQQGYNRPPAPRTRNGRPPRSPPGNPGGRNGQYGPRSRNGRSNGQYGPETGASQEREGYLPAIPPMRPETSNSAPGGARSMSAGRFRESVGSGTSEMLKHLEQRLLRLESENHDMRAELRRSSIQHKVELEAVTTRMQSNGFDGTKVQLELEAMQRARGCCGNPTNGSPLCGAPFGTRDIPTFHTISGGVVLERFPPPPQTPQFSVALSRSPSVPNRLSQAYGALEGAVKQQLTSVQAAEQSNSQRVAELSERVRMSEQQRGALGSQVDQVNGELVAMGGAAALQQALACDNRGRVGGGRDGERLHDAFRFPLRFVV